MRAIVVIDMPKNCCECKINHADVGGYYCPFESILIPTEIALSKRMEWCPLKLPKKMTSSNSAYTWEENFWYREGYNECLDEIVGEIND